MHLHHAAGRHHAGQAVDVQMTVSCPAGADVLEASLYVSQDGNQSRLTKASHRLGVLLVGAYNGRYGDRPSLRSSQPTRESLSTTCTDVAGGCNRQHGSGFD